MKDFVATVCYTKYSNLRFCQKPGVKLLMFHLNVHELNLFSNFQRALIFANFVSKFIVVHTERQKFEGRCKRLSLSKKAIFRSVQTVLPDQSLTS